MKKKTLAIAIIATTATMTTQAAKIIENGSLNYSLNGDLQIQIQKDNGDEKHLYVNFDSLEIENEVAYEVNEDVTAFAELTFDFSDAANADKDQNSAELEDAFLGFEYKFASISVGKQDYATDELGVAEDYEMDSESTAFDTTDGDDVIFATFDLDPVELLLSTELQAKGEDSEGEESFDAFISAELASLELAAAYQRRETEVDGDKQNTYGLSAKYDADFATFAADYSYAEDSLKVYNLVTIFKATDSTDIALGYVKNKPDSESDTNEWYANITYSLPDQEDVKLLAEVSNTDKEDAELAYLAGVQIKF